MGWPYLWKKFLISVFIFLFPQFWQILLYVFESSPWCSTVTLMLMLIVIDVKYLALMALLWGSGRPAPEFQSRRISLRFHGWSAMIIKSLNVLCTSPLKCFCEKFHKVPWGNLVHCEIVGRYLRGDAFYYISRQSGGDRWAFCEWEQMLSIPVYPWWQNPIQEIMYWASEKGHHEVLCRGVPSSTIGPNRVSSRQHKCSAVLYLHSVALSRWTKQERNS